MRTKYIFFLIFSIFPTIAFGDDGWWIYAYEDISTLKSVFNYLALVGTDEGYLSSINLVMLAGMSFIVVYKFMDLSAVPKYFVTTIALLLLTFSTKTTVHIVNVKSYDSLNPRINNYAVIDNIPYIFAVLTSAFSSVGYNTALLVETIFSSISENGEIMETSFLKTGHLGGFKLLEKLDSLDISTFNEDGKLFTNYYKGYLNECVFHIAYAVKPSIEMNLIDSGNIFIDISPNELLNNHSINIGSENIVYDGSIMSCNTLYNLAREKYNKLKNENKIYEASKNLISSITSNIDGASSTIISMMNASDLTNASQKITSYVMNNGIRGAFESAWNSYGVGVSGSQAMGGYGSGLAIAQLQSQGKIKSKSASMVLPSMHSVLQAVMYVLFPLVLIVQLFTGGIKILQNFTLGLLWLEFWVPSFSVLNYFTIKEAQTQSLDKLVNTSTNAIGPDGLLTIANQNEIYNTIANQAAIAGDMFWMIPAIAGFILFASFHSLAGVASMAAGVVGKYSDSQTLEGERSKFAAYNEINEQLKRENPLYTGDVGTVSAMTTTNSNLSSASTAAANFLASGSSLGNMSPLAKANMGKGFEDMTSTSTRVNSLSGGGNISNMSTTVENNANLKASTDKGSSTSVNKDSSLLQKAEDASTIQTLNNANNGSAQKDAFEKSFGSATKGSEISAQVSKGIEVKSLEKNLEQTGDDAEKLIDLKSEQAKAETASTQAKSIEAQNNNQTLAEYSAMDTRAQTAKNISNLNTEIDEKILNDDGGLTQKGKEYFNTKLGTEIGSNWEAYQSVGLEKYRNIMEKESITNTMTLDAKQSQGDLRGGYTNLMERNARNQIDNTSVNLDSQNISGMAKPDGSLTQQGREGSIIENVIKQSETINRGKDINNQDKMNETTEDLVSQIYRAAYQESNGNTSYAEEKAFEALGSLSNNYENIKFDSNGKIVEGKFEALTGNQMANALGTGQASSKLANNVNIAGFDANIGENINSSKNNSSQITTGEKYDIKRADPAVQKALSTTTNEDGSIDYQKAATHLAALDNAKWNMEWKNQLADIAASVGVNLTDEQKESSDISGALTSIVAGVAGATALDKVTAKLNPDNVPKTVDDLKNYAKNSDGSYTNSKTGENFTVGKDGKVYDADGNISMKANPDTKGLVSKTSGYVWTKLGEGIDGIKSSFSSPTSGSDQMPNNTSNSNNSQPDRQVDKPVHNQVEHSEPPKNINNESITQDSDKNNQPKTKEELINNSFDMKSQQITQERLDGKINDSEFGQKMVALENEKKKALNSDFSFEKTPSDNKSIFPNSNQEINKITAPNVMGDEHDGKSKNLFSKAAIALAGAVAVSNADEIKNVTTDMAQSFASHAWTSGHTMKENFAQGAGQFFGDAGESYAAAFENVRNGGNLYDTAALTLNGIANTGDEFVSTATSISNTLFNTKLPTDFASNQGSTYFNNKSVMDDYSPEQIEKLTENQKIIKQDLGKQIEK